MFDPKLTESHPESLKTYPQKVIWAQRNCEAQVVVANWPFSEEGWSDWRVIDCSLLPVGAVHGWIVCRKRELKRSKRCCMCGQGRRGAVFGCICNPVKIRVQVISPLI